VEKQTIRLDTVDIDQVKTLARRTNVTPTEWCRQAVLDRIAGGTVAATVQRELATFHRAVAALHADMDAKEAQRFMAVVQAIKGLHLEIDGEAIAGLRVARTLETAA
jgi:hypothetical protein